MTPRFLIPAVLSLAASLPGLAHADVLLSFNHHNGCQMNKACQQDASIASSTIGGNLPAWAWAYDFIPNNPWSKGYYEGNRTNPVFTLGLKAAQGLQLTDFRFSIKNNDCQYGAPASCRGANWKLVKVVNGIEFTEPLLAFNSGPKFADLDFDVKIDQWLNAGDVFDLKMIYTGGFKDRTGQYFFHDLALDGKAQVDEPQTLALLALGAVGVGVARRRRASTAA
ncbi:PEP-CTERM sorting domain-containing protein [Pelomonas sp. APW6]|uniref:PEP-CTERM sorting domain-containing protein n=1 Tax=Roseateles subflavus TaxID=3053353 RepID=A0ABT7LDW5_9BURK|nr:PEP-CTERM sorting domain-containing protein [Pelomonas sp. APW6]MDL5031055.1 PEP-CTERM sorting domain-containing protein [Pelomonas sp. APW6]